MRLTVKVCSFLRLVLGILLLLFLYFILYPSILYCMNYDVRIKKIIGQLEALSRLSNEGRTECDQVLQQVSAVQGAVTSLKRQIIDNSFEQCLDSKNAQKATKKLLTNIRRYI